MPSPTQLPSDPSQLQYFDPTAVTLQPGELILDQDTDPKTRQTLVLTQRRLIVRSREAVQGAKAKPGWDPPAASIDGTRHVLIRKLIEVRWQEARWGARSHLCAVAGRGAWLPSSVHPPDDPDEMSDVEIPPSLQRIYHSTLAVRRWAGLLVWHRLRDMLPRGSTPSAMRSHPSGIQLFDHETVLWQGHAGTPYPRPRQIRQKVVQVFWITVWLGGWSALAAWQFRWAWSDEPFRIAMGVWGAIAAAVLGLTLWAMGWSVYRKFHPDPPIAYVLTDLRLIAYGLKGKSAKESTIFLDALESLTVRKDPDGRGDIEINLHRLDRIESPHDVARLISDQRARLLAARPTVMEPLPVDLPLDLPVEPPPPVA